jgi:hypothetical protein
MAVDVTQLQERLARDLIEFERKVKYDTLSEQDLELIEKTYEEIHNILHKINNI